MYTFNNLIKRYFTTALEVDSSLTVFDLFQWKKVDVFMKDYKTGAVLVDMKDLEFPISYSQNSCDIIASKYFRKAGLPNELGYENSLKQVSHRMVSFWRDSLIDEGLLETEEEAKIFYDEAVYCLLAQMYAPNSPQWFNTGLASSYGIKGNKQDLYYYDESTAAVVESPDNYSRTQASACFILSIKDSLLGEHSITEQFVTETKLFKGGSGTGTNFSTLRAKNEALSGGGVSSGLMSFLKSFDRSAGAIKSGGTTRRAAKMVCLDIDHPEIMDFINWKSIEEDKVRALGKMSYDIDINGEAYETVSGQNSNNSVRFSDAFMKKVENLAIEPDAKVLLKGRVDSNVDAEKSVAKLWDSFNNCAWQCADPAPQFDDTFNAWHTCPAGKDGDLGAKHNRINSTNPCGEYAFVDDSSCNLSSINIYKFYDIKSKKFDIDGYLHVIGLNQLILESSIHFGQFPTKAIAENTYMFRATGLGMANLASLLMVMGYAYDSEEARAIATALVGTLTGHSYLVSSLMAEKIGSFKAFEQNKASMLKVIRNHCRVVGAYSNTANNKGKATDKTEIQEDFEDLNYSPLTLNHSLLDKCNLLDLSHTVKKVWNEALAQGEKYGYRNAQVSVLAPTGTISFAMDCGATSIEPFFSHMIYKKLSGGGYMTIANPVMKASLENLGYKPEEVEEILNYVMRGETVTENGFTYNKIIDGKLEGAPYLKPEHLPIFDTANTCGTGKRYISPMGHVLMVAALTPVISGAISKTVNLPKYATVEDFKKVIFKSWKLGVKGITLYRDSSKASQPLNNTLSEDKSKKLEDLSYKELLNRVKELETHNKYSIRNKPEGIRFGTTHPAQIEDVKIYTTVNRNQSGEITEIYITTDREGTIITGLLNSLSKSISVMLQYHVPPQDISKMLRGQKYEPYGFVSKHPYIKNVSSISDLISKIIDIELGDFSSCQIKPESYALPNNSATNNVLVANSSLTETKEATKTTSDRHEHDITKGERVYGSTCPTCSSTRLVRNGTCKVCLDCGSTTGCS